VSTPPPCEHLLIGVSGSIHSTQLSSYLLPLKQGFAEKIHVIMTPAAASMVPPATIELLADGVVLTDLWGSPADRSPHITETRWADAFLVLPATANTIGKAANGIADNLLTTALLAYDRPIVFAPAMNPTMWRSPAVQRNVKRLQDDGHHVLPVSEITAVGTGSLDTAFGPTPQTLLPQLWEAFLRDRRQDYLGQTATAGAG
jgi:phosphopantothenoylcysteine decarboxylase/phosphopantothenate--cysteine ligase